MNSRRHGIRRVANLVRTVSALLVLCFVPALGEAQLRPNLEQALARARRVECDFTVLSTGTWAAGGVPSFTSKPAPLKVVFFNVDSQESSAEIEATETSSYYIVVRYVGAYLHLMQIKSEGPIYTTTVYAREAKPGRFLAMHSRHEYTQVSLPGYTSRPEQYLGDCALTPAS